MPRYGYRCIVGHDFDVTCCVDDRNKPKPCPKCKEYAGLEVFAERVDDFSNIQIEIPEGFSGPTARETIENLSPKVRKMWQEEGIRPVPRDDQYDEDSLGMTGA